MTTEVAKYKVTVGDSKSYFLIDKEGQLLHVNLSAKEWCVETATLRELPIRFDVADFRATYGLSERTFYEIYGVQGLPIDLREIGYFCHSGNHYPASPQFQLKKMRQWLLETAEHLDNVSASLETMLIYVETPDKSPIPGEDHRNRWNVCRTARQYLRETNPLTAGIYAEEPADAEEVDDQPAGEFVGTLLPDGVIGYRAAGRCSCGSAVCPIEIQENDLVLLDNHSGLLYCCRECLDYARQIMPPKVIPPKP